jgi:hypothetical protein
VLVQPLGPQDIRRILAVTDELGLHRESIRVPLARRAAGSVRVTDAGQVEIVAPEGDGLETWLEALPETLRALDLSRLHRGS